MSVQEIHTYEFTCATMRYTDDTRTMVVLCDGREVFTGTSLAAAGDKAKANGWYCDRADYFYANPEDLYGLACPFHHHKLDAGQVPWPPVGSPLREQPEDGRELD